MKLLTALALLSSTQAVKLRAKEGGLNFPAISIADPAKVANAISGGLAEARKEVARELASTWEDCNRGYYDDEKHTWVESDKEICKTRERGLIRDLRRANEDAVRGLEEVGIDFSKNTYDPKFITDLLLAEYDDFVKQFNAHKDDAVKMLSAAPGELDKVAGAVGLAQSEKKSCWRQFEEKHPYPQSQGKEFDWDARRKLEDAFMTKCYTESSAMAKAVADELPSDAEIIQMINGVIAGGAADLATNEAKRAEHVAHMVEELNGMLTHEAERVGLAAPSLPDPKDTGAKIVSALKKGLTMASGEDFKRGMTREIPRAKADLIRDVYRADRDLSRVADERNGQMASKMASQIGITVSADDINAFTKAAVAEITGLAENPKEAEEVVRKVNTM